jgi:hypothetical protein
MVAQAPDRRTGRLAGAAVIALFLIGLTLLLEPASWRPAAAALLAVGLAVGILAAMRLRSSGRLRTPMERLNDAAFLVVISAVALIAVRLARPWTAALPGVVAGTLLGLTLRPRPGPESAPGAGSGPTPDPGPDPRHADPRHAGPPPAGGEPPGGGH